MSGFTEEKHRVRALNLRAMEGCLHDPKKSGGWSYFGLPSPDMEDVLCWRDYLRSVDAVERGMPGREWKAYHDIARTAILNGIPGFRLHKGDIDEIMLAGDSIEWTFDIVNLDYTGGITYKDESRQSKRISALRRLLQRQGQEKKSFFLTITANDRHQDLGEIRAVVTNVSARCKGREDDIERKVANAVADRDKRLAVFYYTTYVVTASAQPWFKVRVFKPIFYTGRGNYRMINMSFFLQALPQLDAPVGESFDLAKMFDIEIMNLDGEQES